MIEDRIRKTESAVAADRNIPSDKKAELLGRLSKLKSALAKASQTHPEDAESIAHFVETSAHEATRKKKKPKLLETAVHGLKQSVDDFEASHPELVEAVNDFATLLSNMGI